MTDPTFANLQGKKGSFEETARRIISLRELITALEYDIALLADLLSGEEALEILANVSTLIKEVFRREHLARKFTNRQVVALAKRQHQNVDSEGKLLSRGSGGLELEYDELNNVKHLQKRTFRQYSRPADPAVTAWLNDIIRTCSELRSQIRSGFNSKEVFHEPQSLEPGRTAQQLSREKRRLEANFGYHLRKTQKSASKKKNPQSSQRRPRSKQFSKRPQKK